MSESTHPRRELLPSIFGVVLGLLPVGCGPDIPGLEGDGDAGPVCGDGILALDELCDDGNRVASDGCSPECVPSGTHVDCVTIFEGTVADEVHALLPLADRTFLVAGEQETMAGVRGWVGRFDESGEPLWFEQLADDSSGRVVDLAVDGQSGCWALMQSGMQSLLIHVDEEGGTSEAIDLAELAGASVLAHAVEYGDNEVWIGGATQGDLWLARYDLGSETLTTVLNEDYLGLGFSDEILALGRSPTEVAVAGTVSTSPNFDGDIILTATTDILIVRFDLQGTEIGRSVASADPESLFARRALDVVSAGAGGWISGGIQTPIEPLADYPIWVARSEPAPAWEWTSYGLLDELGLGYGGIVGIEGALVMAGGSHAVDALGTPAVDGWVAGFDADGTLRWQQSHTNPDHTYYENKLISVDPEDRLRIVAKTWTSDESAAFQSCLIAR